MTWIALQVAGQWVDLAENQTLAIELDYAPLDFDTWNSQRVMDLDLPATAKNDAVFGLAREPGMRRRNWRDYPAALYVGGELWQEGTFTLLRYEGSDYRGYFAGGAALLQEIKNKSLREVLSGVPVMITSGLYQKQNSNEPDYVLLDGYEDADGAVCFPDMWMPAYSHGRRRNNQANARLGNTSLYLHTTGYPLIPCLKVWRVLEMVLSTVGYSLSDEYRARFSHWRRLFLVSAYMPPEPVEVFANVTQWNVVLDAGNLVPKQKVGDFVNDVRKLLGAAMIVDGVRKTVILRPLEDILRSPHTEDWTARAQPRYDIEVGYVDGYALQWGGDRTIGRLHESPETIEQVDGSVSLLADLPDLGSAVAGPVYFLRALNALYRWALDVDGNAVWLYVGPQHYDLAIDGGEKVYSLECRPGRQDDVLMQEVSGAQVIDNAGSVRIEMDGKLAGPLVASTVVDVLLREREDEGDKAGYESSGWVPVLTAAEGYVDTAIPYVQDARVTVQIRHTLTRRRYIVDDVPGDIPQANLQNVDWKPVLGIYHGIIAQNGVGINYASVDGLGPAGEELGGVALRWQEDDGLHAAHYAALTPYLRDQREVSYYLQLAITDILNLRPYIKKVIDGEVLLLKSIRVNATTQGMAVAECTFYVI